MYLVSLESSLEMQENGDGFMLISFSYPSFKFEENNHIIKSVQGSTHETVPNCLL